MNFILVDFDKFELRSEKDQNVDPDLIKSVVLVTNFV